MERGYYVNVTRRFAAPKAFPADRQVVQKRSFEENMSAKAKQLSKQAAKKEQQLAPSNVDFVLPRLKTRPLLQVAAAAAAPQPLRRKPKRLPLHGCAR